MTPAQYPTSRAYPALFIRVVPMALFLTLLGGCSLFSGNPDFTTLSGEAISEAPAPMADDAHLEVRLLDITEGRSTIAQVIQHSHGQWPVPFTLQYDRDSIDESRRYALSAALTEDDSTRYLTLEPLPVLTHGAPGQNVSVPLSPISP